MRCSATIGVALLLSLGGGAVLAQNNSAQNNLAQNNSAQNNLAQDNQATEPQIREPQVTQPQASPPQVEQQQTQSGDPVADMIGAWELSNADHDRICKLNFRKDAAPNGYKLDVDRNCPNVFPSTKDIVAWSIDNFGGLRLLDGNGEAVIELSGVEGGMFDGFKPEEGRYVLQAAAAVQTRSADDLV